MIGIVIVAHGGLAHEFLAAVEHVVGIQPGIRAVTVDRDHNRTDTEAEICAAANAVDGGDGVVVVTDLFGGSPSNLAMLACRPNNRRILFGANMPLLIKLAKNRHLSLPDAVRAAKDAGRKYIDSQNISMEDEPT